MLSWWLLIAVASVTEVAGVDGQARRTRSQVRWRAVDGPWLARGVEQVTADLGVACAALDDGYVRETVRQAAIELAATAPPDPPRRVRLRANGRLQAALGRPLIIRASASR